MKTILGVSIPEALADLDDEALAKLSEDLRVAGKAALSAEAITPDIVGEAKDAVALRGDIATLQTERAEATEQLAADVAEAQAAFAEEEAEEETTDEVETAEVETEGESTEEEVEAVVASAYVPVVSGAAALADDAGAPTVVVPDAVQPSPASAFLPLDSMVAGSGLSTVGVGEKFPTFTHLAEGLKDRWDDIRGGGTEKIAVARIPAVFKPERVLVEGDMAGNVEKFGGLDPLTPAFQAIVAAMCAPVEPYYGLGCMSDTSRPVRGSMASYRAPRGGVSVYPTPRLSSISNGRGVWTRANDADADAVKAACSTIACASPVQYDIYGIYRCMTIKNMLAMTYPELVEAYLNRLAALTARLAEITLLDAMMGSTNLKDVTVDADDFSVDGSINLWTTVINALALYREEERFGSQQLQGWMPRWVVPQLQIGLARMKRTSGAFRDRIATQGEIEAILRDLGVDITWSMDVATAWDAITLPTDGAALPALPSTVDMILSPKGNFRVLDEGNLTIGVTNNNIYRDNTSNTRNQFTIFQESFEGLIDFGCRSYHVQIDNFSPNGAQTADVEPVAA